MVYEASNSTKKNSTIVIIHGFGGKRIWLMPLAARLAKQGYQVKHHRYLSFLGSIEGHARRLAEYLEQVQAESDTLFVVAHSMGSIVLRAAMQLRKFEKLKRIVFVAPPHSGSPTARLGSIATAGLCRPLNELSNRQNSFVNRLPDRLSVDCGIIAGRFDFLVPLPYTHLPGIEERIVLNATHNTLLFMNKTARFAGAFFETGKFSNVA